MGTEQYWVHDGKQDKYVVKILYAYKINKIINKSKLLIPIRYSIKTKSYF